MAEIPFLDLSRRCISDAAVASIPECIAREDSILAIDDDGGVLTVVLSDAKNWELREQITLLFDRKIEFAWSFHDSILKAIERHYPRQQKP